MSQLTRATFKENVNAMTTRGGMFRLHKKDAQPKQKEVLDPYPVRGIKF